MTRLPPLTQIPAQIAALSDYQAYAQARMSPAAWAYFSGGAADELTVHDNQLAFQQIRLRPRVLRDLAGANTGLSLLGASLDYPVLLAPVALQTMAHPEGELATALAASAMKAGMVVSTQSSVRLETIAQAAQTLLWFQLYLQPDREASAKLVERAEQAGYRALVVTVDAPASGVRNREQRAGFALPPGVSAVNLADLPQPLRFTAQVGASPLFATPLLDAAPTWQDIAWLRSITDLPILLKGVLSAEDAQLALQAGVSGLIVSNHGGRTLDTLPATITALPEIAAVVDGRIPLLLDGGIRRGTDVVKALALGATAVLIGRPYLYALASAGALGVAHVLHLLRAELEMAMALCGCRTLADIDRQVLWQR